MPWSAAVGTILGAESASSFEELIAAGGLARLRAVAHRTKGYAAAVTLAVDYLRAQRLRVLMKDALDTLLGGFDALVAPTVPIVAHPLGRDFMRPPSAAPTPPPSPGPVAPTAPGTIPAGNIAGLPALCLPNGTGRNGLPTSLQFLGRAFTEPSLVALGMRYQAATDWHTRRPPVADGTR
jgi:aspartyl-tRNA(Asn)/glutamyl-tRNA(Gln) amidotransferase subunit A